MEEAATWWSGPTGLVISARAIITRWRCRRTAGHYFTNQVVLLLAPRSCCGTGNWHLIVLAGEEALFYCQLIWCRRSKMPAMEESPGAIPAPWFAVMTKHGAEDRVARQIHTLLNREVYVPRIEVQVKKSRSLVTAIRPLFPHYLFARLHIPQEWRLITFTRGSLRLLGGWQEPQPVSEAIIEFIRSREKDHDQIIQYYNFKEDDHVFITQGPLREFHGIFERYVDDYGRVRVLLSLLSYQASVVLEASSLEKA